MLVTLPHALRNRMQLNANQAFYLLVNNKSIASMSTSMAEIYRDDKVSRQQCDLLVNGKVTDMQLLFSRRTTTVSST